jgi:uncharacterized protein YaiL (DUF2058 family)
MARYKVSKTRAREYAAQMAEIDQYCKDNGINQSRSSDSYYFTVSGQKYRISNHTVEQSNRKAFHEDYGQVRDLYHDGRESDTIYITASKTRIIEIHKDLVAGKKLDKRGRAN